MSTIEIVQEHLDADRVVYRACYHNWQAVGATPGAALDAIEKMMATASEDGDGTVVIVQRFRPDAFFTANQQARLREIMERFHAANKTGAKLTQKDRKDLEALVDAEWQAAIDRGAKILKAAHVL